MMGATLPTTDLYFLNSCRGWVRRGWRGGPVRRLGSNSFRCGDRFLLIRKDTPQLMEQALRWSGPLVYLIDDDIGAAAETASLPEGYRHRLTAFAGSYHEQLLRRANIVVTPSDTLSKQLAKDFGIQKIRHLMPYWDQRPASQAHFDGISTMLKVAHLGSASHAGGLAAIMPALLDLIDETPHLHFTYVSPRGLHPKLEGHDRIRRLAPMKWPRYRRWLGWQRFHLALYPLENARFDRARSANKLFEHGIVGAVGVYPSDWPPAAMLGDGAIGAPSDPTQWRNCLRSAISAPAELRSRAWKAAQALARHVDPIAQQTFWRDILGLEAPRI